MGTDRQLKGQAPSLLQRGDALAMMLLTVSTMSRRHMEGLPRQVGTAEKSHSRPAWAAARERGAQPQFCTGGTRQCCDLCNDPHQTPLCCPCCGWGGGCWIFPRSERS